MMKIMVHISMLLMYTSVCMWICYTMRSNAQSSCCVFFHSFIRSFTYSLSILHNILLFYRFSFLPVYTYIFFKYLFLLLSFIYHCSGRAVLFGCSLSLQSTCSCMNLPFPKKLYTDTLSLSHAHKCARSHT